MLQLVAVDRDPGTGQHLRKDTLGLHGLQTSRPVVGILRPAHVDHAGDTPGQHVGQDLLVAGLSQLARPRDLIEPVQQGEPRILLQRRPRVLGAGLRQTEDAQRRRVQPPGVHVPGDEQRGDVTGDGIELGHGGETGPVGQAVPEALDRGGPRTRRQVPQRPGHQLQGLLGAARGQRVDASRARRLHVQVGVGVPQAGDEEGTIGLKRWRTRSMEPPPHLDDATTRHTHVDGLTRAGRRIQ